MKKIHLPLLLIANVLMAATPSPTSNVAWEQDKWDKSCYSLLAPITQAQFESFCTEHSDLRTLEITSSEQITSLAPLAKLTQLKTLRLNHVGKESKHNQPKARFNLSPLSNLTQLTKLDCYCTHVSNVAALKKLTQLKDLSFYMSDVNESLDGLPESIENIKLHGSNPPNYTIFSKLKLKTIDIHFNNAANPKNLTVLQDMQSLEEIDLALTKTITDIKYLSNCSNLKKISIWDDPVSDISPLSGKKHLSDIDISGTKIQDIKALSDCKNLSRVAICDTSVTDISILGNNPNLTCVRLSNSPIKSIEALRDKPDLTMVDIDGTMVSDLSPLFNNKKLRTLLISPGLPANQLDRIKANNPSIWIRVEAPKPKSRKR